MPRPRIFVSHSNNDPPAQDWLDRISQALDREGFEVLLDRKRLTPGSSWRDEIYSWLGLCHGAVILVSDAAVRPGSIWVPRETSILLWRRTLEPDLVVVPVCLPSIDPVQLGTGVFADTLLNEITACRESCPEDTAQAVLERFRRLTAPKTALELLALRVAELLKSVSDAAIEEAMEQLQGDLAPSCLNEATRYRLALALLSVRFNDAIDAIEILAEFLDSAKADQLLAIVSPSWVDLCAARWLAECATRADNKPAAILNASTMFSAQMYVYRAGCRPPKTRWPVIPITAVHGERVADELCGEVEASLISEFRLDDDPFSQNLGARLRAMLDERQRQRKPVFVALRYSPAVAAELSQLQRAFPAVTFILLSGDQFPPEAQLTAKNVLLIKPELPLGEEVRAQTSYDYARSIIRP
ncbi:MAG: toll/interleukin-1 receptor domain-containing protein [Bryobacterales bacterium]|nr:toll/interleukin-1 receptor domain-containing protein [Bryobacterales bacterium]